MMKEIKILFLYFNFISGYKLINMIPEDTQSDNTFASDNCIELKQYNAYKCVHVIIDYTKFVPVVPRIMQRITNCGLITKISSIQHLKLKHKTTYSGRCNFYLSANVDNDTFNDLIMYKDHFRPFSRIILYQRNCERLQLNNQSISRAYSIPLHLMCVEVRTKFSTYIPDNTYITNMLTRRRMLLHGNDNKFNLVINSNEYHPTFNPRLNPIKNSIEIVYFDCEPYMMRVFNENNSSFKCDYSISMCISVIRNL